MIHGSMADAQTAVGMQGTFGQNMSPVTTTPGGKFIAPPLNRIPYQVQIIAKITNTGPNGEDNYADERYWFKSQYIKQTYSQSGDYNTDPVALSDQVVDFPDQSTWSTATNLTEIAGHTHTLAVGSTVIITGRVGVMAGMTYANLIDPTDQYANAFYQYTFETTSGGGAVVIKLGSNSTTGGVYTARLWTSVSTDISVVGATFDETTLGTGPGSDDGYFFNLAEITQTSHDLTSATPAIVLLNATLWHTNSDGKNIYVGYIVAPGCTP